MTTRSFMNSELRGILRACAVESPPGRAELVREFRAIGIPANLENAALEAAAVVAKAANSGRVGARKAQARQLADEVGEKVWQAWQSTDTLAPTDPDPDDGEYDYDGSAAAIRARTASGDGTRGRPHTDVRKPSVAWRQR